MPATSPPSKYKSPPDYYSDALAVQGVFSKTIEPMANAPKMSGTKISDSTKPVSNVRSFQAQDNDRSSNPIRQQYIKSPQEKKRPFQDQRAEQSVPEASTHRTFQSSTATDASTYPTGQRVNNWKEEINCANTPYGCCSDGVTIKTQQGCPAPADPGCMGSQYGCCDDGITVKNSTGSNCAPYPPTQSSTQPTTDQTSTSTQPTTDQTSTQPTSTDQTSTSTSTQPTSTDQTSTDQTSTQPTSTSTQPTSTDQTSTQPTSTSTQPVQMVSQSQPVQIQSSVQPNDPYASYTSSQPQPLDTVYLSPPIGKPAVPTCPIPQPCPPCGRCPEPSFDCKKVPNYSNTSNVLPVPILNDFSQFGM
jgi:hypothetical protein